MKKKLSFAHYFAAITAGLLLTVANSAPATVSFDFVDIGHAGNAGYVDGSNTIGAVAYDYRAADKEVSVDQYVEFLNAVAATDTNSLWDVQQDITQSGSSGSFTYAAVAGKENHPVAYLEWRDAARFVNWLENGQPTGAQDLTTTEDGVYLIGDGASEVRAAGASFFLPSRDEWVKAAYHKNNGVTGDFFLYGTTNDTLPTPELQPGGVNSANYINANPTLDDTMPVGKYNLTFSAYGLYDMTGNVSEFNEAILFGFAREVRGGGYTNGSLQLINTWESIVSPAEQSPVAGFRIFASTVESTNCIVGDANCDGYVDVSSDILSAFSNFTGPGSTHKTRAEGDVEGGGVQTTTPDPADGDVDVSDILAMFGGFTGPAPDEAGFGVAEAGDPAIPDLVYDSVTGEVFLDKDGAGMIGYSLKSAGAFLAGGHTPLLGGVSTSLSTELAEAALSSPPAGLNSIGVVLPAGLDLAALSGLLTTNEVSTGLGAPLVPFDLVVLTTGPVVPEPATLVLSALGLVGMGLCVARKKVAYRRRQAACR